MQKYPPLLYISLLTLIVFSLSSCGKDTSNTTLPPSKPSAAKQEKTTQTKVMPTPQLTAEQSGEKVFKRCRACHTVNENGKHKVGPNLWGIFGRNAGSAEGYAYSKAMLEFKTVWTEETLSAYLENPRTYIPKNKMAFAGLRKKDERNNVLSYLKANTQQR